LRNRVIVEVLDEAQRGEIDLSGLWVARERRGRIAGALMTQSLAGKAAAVWAPEVRPSWRRAELAAGLVKEALADLKVRGFRLAQAVLDESAFPQAGRDLRRGGMPRITELLNLERDTGIPFSRDLVQPNWVPDRSIEPPKGEPRFLSDAHSPFEWRPFGADLEAEFRSVLQATYADSLDMPELEGARSLDDILESHRAAGRFVPERWRLGRISGKPQAAAVLLLAEVPGRNVWEVVYLGLTPAARGCGLGRSVIQHALELARGHVPWLELAVDQRNTPALRLYRDTGFIVRDRRAVHLMIFTPSPTCP
jgi:ribosomal protein S18 acetylase RimI-like enzyme